VPASTPAPPRSFTPRPPHSRRYQHQEIGDGYVFGVRDAVDEFAAARHTRVYSTMETYLPSFYFLKCTHD